MSGNIDCSSYRLGFSRDCLGMMEANLGLRCLASRTANQTDDMEVILLQGPENKIDKNMERTILIWVLV